MLSTVSAPVVSKNLEVIAAKTAALNSFLKQYNQTISEADSKSILESIQSIEVAMPCQSVGDAKSRAKDLQANLQRYGITLSMQKCLEGFAKLSNYKNWSTMSAKLTPIRSKDSMVLIREHTNIVYVSSRFGEWIADRGPLRDGLNFSDAMGEVFENYTPELGDPRYFMGDSEMSFLCFLDGQFGVLSEIELAYSVNEDIDPANLDEEGRDDYGSMIVSAEQYKAHTKTHQEILEKFVKGPGRQFSKTSFFISTEGFMDRMIVCGFTPLNEPTPNFFSSVYTEPDKIKKMENALQDAVFAPTTTP